MKIPQRILCIWLLFSFLGTSVAPPPAQAQSDSTALPFSLPKPGTMVNLSPAFQPVLIKGLKVHPENPFMFDFIVDPGQEQLSDSDFKKTSQRMINYFLASLATPEKDLWVNLSPVEKNHIIPDTLIKTELGRDLLAEDYMLKQIGSSLIYPESNLGKTFWNKVYTQAYQKFGVTQVPVNVFNKIWILPEKATVFERGNTVYIVKAHLKVMLEEDYLAQKVLGNRINKETSNVAVKDISKQVMREIVVPAVEKEVNEGKNFASLRQVFYALILAQWYQDVFKQSILNKDYSGRDKVVGIDVSDPKNKDLIYHQYLSAYKKGVFNYIKEETDQLTQEPVPRKYFSGGFVDQKVDREEASASDANRAMASAAVDLDLNVELKPSTQEEPLLSWYDLNRPLSLFKELQGFFKDGELDHGGFYAFIDKYSPYIEKQRLYPVQSAWPVLKAITLLSASEEMDLVEALQEKYSSGARPELVDKILLMNNIFDRREWLKQRAPHLLGRKMYLVAAEIHYWAGGLGPVMKFHGKGMHDLGADVAYIEPWYQLRRDKGNPDGDPLDYEDPGIGLKDMDYNFDEFDVEVGDVFGKIVQKVHVKVATGIDENGIRIYMFRDIWPDGSSFYTKMLYNYTGRNNPVTQEESMAFLNIASAALIERLEKRRMQEQGENWKPAVVHGNDGQFGPLQAVTMSQYGSEEAVKNIFWAFTTHTYRNRGNNHGSITEKIRNVTGAIDVFLKHMMRIKDRFINAFRQGDHIDYTSGGVRLANWAGAVSNRQRDDVSYLDPNSNLVAVTNGAVPEEMASIFRVEFEKLRQEGKISEAADYERPTAQEDALTKIEAKKMLNAAGIRTANGGTVQVDLDEPLLGYVRRLVPEKAGKNRAFTNQNIWELVRLGYNVVLMGNHQGYAESEALAIDLRQLEISIAGYKKENPSAFPGNFQFVQSFTPEQKKLFLAAADVDVKDSDNHTGAAEFSEEDITANGGYEAGPTYREGVITDQGIPVDWDHPGAGQTLIPKEDTARSWLETVYKPLIDLWNKDSDHIDFYKNAALSPRLNRIQRYLITSAAYLRQYEYGLAQQEKEIQEDQDALKKISSALGEDQEIIKGVLYAGRNGVTEPFGFLVWNQGISYAKSKGLMAFIKMKNALEDKFGYDALLHHYEAGDFQNYLGELVHETPAEPLLNAAIENIQNDANTTQLQQAVRLGQLEQNLATMLEAKLQTTVTDSAMTTNPGGIKLDNIKVERQGSLMTDIVSDKTLEDMLLKARGLYGVIVGITPISSLPDFIQ